MLVSVGTQAFRTVIQTVSTLVLARLLSPEDFGRVTMVTATYGIVLLLKDLGLSAATIQSKDITSDQSSFLFWTNVLAGMCVSLIILATAPALSLFYGTTELQPIAYAYALIAPISSLGAQHAALLSRAMRFKAIALRDLAAAITGASAGITSAAMGAGFWSLLIMQATSAIAGTIALWHSNPWRPSFPRWVPDAVPLLKFGRSMTIGSLLQYFNHNLDSILLGKFFGPAELGIYNRAQGLLNRPLATFMPSITQVILPLMSRIRDDHEEFRTTTLQLLSLSAAFGGLLVTPIVAWSELIVLVLLGEAWSSASPIVAILGVFLIFEPASYLLGSVLIAAGFPDKMARWRAWTLALTVLAFALGVPYGPIGIAVAYSTSGLVTRVWLGSIVARQSSIPRVSMLRAIAPYILATVVAITSSMMLADRFNLGIPLVELMAGCGASLFIYSLIITLIPESRSTVTGTAHRLWAATKSQRESKQRADA